MRTHQSVMLPMVVVVHCLRFSAAGAAVVAAVALGAACCCFVVTGIVGIVGNVVFWNGRMHMWSMRG